RIRRWNAEAVQSAAAAADGPRQRLGLPLDEEDQHLVGTEPPLNLCNRRTVLRRLANERAIVIGVKGKLAGSLGDRERTARVVATEVELDELVSGVPGPILETPPGIHLAPVDQSLRVEVEGGSQVGGGAKAIPTLGTEVCSPFVRIHDRECPIPQ